MAVIDIDRRTLPHPTRDREQIARDLETHGYAIVADVLTKEQTAALRARVVEQAADERAAGVAAHEPPNNQRLWMMVNKAAMFRDLVGHPLMAEMMTPLLGPDFLLSSLSANIARPGGVPMYLHRDQGYVDFWTPKPLVANIAWMLDDFTDENGGTRLVPGSHREPKHKGYTLEDTIAAEGPAGAALIFDGRLFHGTGPNRTASEERHAILSYCCRPYIRQQENFFLGLDPKIRVAEREDVLRRLGYFIWANNLGRVEKPTEKGPLAPLTNPIGPLDVNGQPLAV